LRTIIVSRGCHTRPRKFKFKQKGRQTAITICRGLSHPTVRAAFPSDKISGHFFQRVEKPSDDINNHLFLMNKKGFKGGINRFAVIEVTVFMVYNIEVLKVQ
jgi:hypothetical protein